MPIFHFPSFCNELHSVDALFARTQTNCGSGKTVYSASSIETFLSSRYYSRSSSFSQLVVCKRRILVKAFKFSKWSGPSDNSDMNESQSWSLLSLNFLSADLTWLDMYIWLSLLNPCLHNDETRNNLNNWCFWLLSILNLLNKSNHR